MEPREFLRQTRSALIRKGVTPLRVSSLLEEWNDHLESEIEQLQASGLPIESAAEQACAALGEPQSLADRAASQLQASTWRGRHPWLTAFLAAFLLLVSSGLALTLTLILYGKVVGWDQPDTIGTSSFWFIKVLQWIPLGLGLVWLGWHARSRPSGWKGFWITTALVALVFGLLTVMIQPPRTDRAPARLRLGMVWDSACC